MMKHSAEPRRKNSMASPVIHGILGGLNIVPVVLMLFCWKPGDNMGMLVTKGFSLFTKLLVIGLVITAGLIDLMLCASGKLTRRTAVISFCIYTGITCIWIASTLLLTAVLNVI